MKATDKIKNGLRHCWEDGCENCPYEIDCDIESGYVALSRDAFEYIDKLEHKISDLTKMVPQWINVEDRLPENDERCIVWNGDRIEAVDYWGDGKWANHYFGVMIHNVTYWMPLPEPPKEE